MKRPVVTKTLSCVFIWIGSDSITSCLPDSDEPEAWDSMPVLASPAPKSHSLSLSCCWRGQDWRPWHTRSTVLNHRWAWLHTSHCHAGWSKTVVCFHREQPGRTLNTRDICWQAQLPENSSYHLAQPRRLYFPRSDGKVYEEVNECQHLLSLISNVRKLVNWLTIWIESLGPSPW